LHKYDLNNFTICNVHTVIVVRCKNGNTILGYFQNPFPYSKIIGDAYLFEFYNLTSFEVGELDGWVDIKK
jgi:hypothetical protein